MKKSKTSNESIKNKSPFKLEWIRYENPMRGGLQIIFLHICKDTKKIRKYTIL
mgnify:CR=1 FL=1|tara:strand:- start:1583 stop:1741 length:159 start_codon:yes stop_codon:yes gene_type:complete